MVIEAAKTQREEARNGLQFVKTRQLQREADIKLEYLKMQIRKAYTLRQTDEKTYEVWAGLARELGELLGGWIKKTTPASRPQAVPPQQAKQGKLF